WLGASRRAPTRSMHCSTCDCAYSKPRRSIGSSRRAGTTLDDGLWVRAADAPAVAGIRAQPALVQFTAGYVARFETPTIEPVTWLVVASGCARVPRGRVARRERLPSGFVDLPIGAVQRHTEDV